MKRILESENTTRLLLLIISILLGFMVYFGKKQVDTTENLSNRFSKFQIQTVKDNSSVVKSLERTQIWTEDVYNSEIHPNTLRSTKNEKDIIHIKVDVNNLKSRLK